MPSANSVTFNFRDLGDVRPALGQCAIGSQGQSIIDAHLAPLKRLAVRLKATDCALDNVERLAIGFEDIVIVLLEPSDQEEHYSFGEILSREGNSYASAVQLLDQALRLAFENQRSVDNTIILDSRPLRSRKVRCSENDATREQNDAASYKALNEVLSLLRPKVIVVCHCEEDGIQHGMPPSLRSSVRDAGTTSFLTMENGHDCVKVSSFHPMFFARTESNKPLQRVMRENLFDATLVVAANTLAGLTVKGFGIENLRRCALDGPSFRLTPAGVEISYQWLGTEDVASPRLIRRLNELCLLQDPEVSVNHLLSMSC
jgi:hypothetical protein